MISYAACLRKESVWTTPSTIWSASLEFLLVSTTKRSFLVFLFKLPNPLSHSLGKKWNISCSKLVRSMTMRLAMKSCVILQCGSEMVGALWVTEMSSPFLHLRELLKEMGYRDTAINLAADVSQISFLFVNCNINRLLRPKGTNKRVWWTDFVCCHIYSCKDGGGTLYHLRNSICRKPAND